MIAKSYVASQIINEYVRTEIAGLLHGQGICELDSYGWSGPDTYDDEFIGHAMWQTDSLLARVRDSQISTMLPQTLLPPQLEAWQKFLVKSGGDFEGLMEAARLSIGLTLLQQRDTDRQHYAEDSFFQVHLIASMMMLSAASDRLRDIFIAIVFRQETYEYEKEKKARGKDLKRRWYNAPFIEAARRMSDDPCCIVTSIAALPALAKRIYDFRETRNAVVHKIATELGRQMRDLAASAPIMGAAFPRGEVSRQQREKIDAEYRLRISNDVNRIVSWFKLLIETSNHVFTVENASTRCKKPYCVFWQG